MTTDMRAAALDSRDHQPQALGFMPSMPAPRARRVIFASGDLPAARYGITGRGGTGVETISELVVWP